MLINDPMDLVQRPRPALSQYAPRILSLRIDPAKIGTVIGPGGKTIRSIEETGATVGVEDDGMVTVTSVDAEAGEEAMRMIQALAQGINRYLAAMDAAGTLADGRDLARYRLGYPTHHIPARLKALGVAIDDRVRQKWLEPGQAGRQLSLPTMGRTGTDTIDSAAFLRQYQNLIGPIIEEERKERDQ